MYYIQQDNAQSENKNQQFATSANKYRENEKKRSVKKILKGG